MGLAEVEASGEGSVLENQDTKCHGTLHSWLPSCTNLLFCYTPLASNHNQSSSTDRQQWLKRPQTQAM